MGVGLGSCQWKQAETPLKQPYPLGAPPPEPTSGFLPSSFQVILGEEGGAGVAREVVLPVGWGPQRGDETQPPKPDQTRMQQKSQIC